MESSPYTDVGKTGASAFYGALSGSVCFPMPLMYNPINSYPFMSAPFLPVHHPMLSQHGLQDSNHILGTDLVGSGTDAMSPKSEDLSSRALAFLQNRYQSIGKCYLTPNSTRRNTMPKYCINGPGLLDMSHSTGSGTYFPKEKSSPGGLGFGPDSEGSGSMGQTSMSEKESYLSSPTTEMEEPDSSGKCTADVEEQKVIPRWNCDSNQPPICPICGRSVSLAELEDHYRTEMDRLNEITRKKEWSTQNDSQSEQTNQIEQLRMHPYHNVEKRCPEFRKETYLRVRANRMSRLGVCNARVKKQNYDDAERSWKMHRIRQLCSPKRENTADDTFQTGDTTLQSGQQSMIMLELTDLPKTGDCPPLVDSSSNSFNTPDFGPFQSSKCGVDLIRRSECNADSDTCTTTDVKCFVCTEQYRKPVVSVCCWHVHCENCWLKSLGSKRLCPQCETITSPTDLRRIHL